MGYEYILIISMMFLLLTKLIVYKLSLLFWFSLANSLCSFISQQKVWQDDSRSLIIFESLFKSSEIWKHIYVSRRVEFYLPYEFFPGTTWKYITKSTITNY